MSQCSSCSPRDPTPLIPWDPISVPVRFAPTLSRCQRAGGACKPFTLTQAVWPRPAPPWNLASNFKFLCCRQVIGPEDRGEVGRATVVMPSFLWVPSIVPSTHHDWTPPFTTNQSRGGRHRIPINPPRLPPTLRDSESRASAALGATSGGGRRIVGHASWTGGLMGKWPTADIFLPLCG